jgi:hypothetical protein
MKTTEKQYSRLMSKDLLNLKRRHSRFDVNGFVADIADGNIVLGGIVEDVSFNGFKMSNLPKNFSAARRSYTTVISGNNKHYRCIVVPCWTQKADKSRFVEVGFKIVQAPWEWTEFVLSAALPLALAEDLAFQA